MLYTRKMIDDMKLTLDQMDEMNPKYDQLLHSYYDALDIYVSWLQAEKIRAALPFLLSTGWEVHSKLTIHGVDYYITVRTDSDYITASRNAANVRIHRKDDDTFWRSINCSSLYKAAFMIHFEHETNRSNEQRRLIDVSFDEW